MTTATGMPRCALGPEDSGAVSSAVEIYLLGIELAGEPIMQHAMEAGLALDELQEAGAKLMLAGRVLGGLGKHPAYPLGADALRLLPELEAIARESVERDREHGGVQDLLFSDARLQRLEGVRETVDRLAGEMGGGA
jgi:hypothetical protein